MVKGNTNGSIEKEEKSDLFNIFMDETASQLEDKFLRSKRKFLNAKVKFYLIIFREETMNYLIS